MKPTETQISPFTENDFRTFESQQRVRIGWRTNRRKGRCVDGRYKENQMKDAPLATAGGNAGNLASALAARNALDIRSDRTLFVQALIITLGGKISSFGMHDLAEALIEEKPIHCGHFANIFADPEAYGLTGQDMDFLKRTLTELKHKGATEEILDGPHAERAIADIIRTDIDLKPRSNDAQVFVHHSALEREFLDHYAHHLAQIGAVSDESAFFQAMSQQSANHLETTVTRLPSARGISTFQVR